MFLNASSFVEGVDLTFAIIFGISLVFLVGITVVMIWFLIRYHHKRNPKATDIPDHRGLEILWTVVPTILVLVMFYFGWAGYKDMRQVPDDAMEVTAVGRMWSWSFIYDNGKVSDTLVVPINKPVKLDLISEDVIHSLYIPAFRVKEDVNPGDTNYMWFESGEIGSYHILCAEYCGDRHAYMLSKVDVVAEADYQKWYNTKVDTTDTKAMGLGLLKANACMSCHSIDGTQMVGPSFLGLMNRETNVSIDGQMQTIIADRDYFKRAIENPGAEIVEGYQPSMPPYPGKFSDKDIDMMIDYINSLK